MHRGQRLDVRAALELRIDSLMKRNMERGDARGAFVGVEFSVARNWRALGFLGDKIVGVEFAIGIDQETRGGRGDKRRIQELRHAQGKSVGANVPGDMLGERAFAEAKPAEAGRHEIGGVLAGQQHGRAPVRILDDSFETPDLGHPASLAAGYGYQISGFRVIVNIETWIQFDREAQTLMTGSTIEADIHQAIGNLTAAESRAARALLANYPTLGLAPVAEFAEAAGASPATVLRFVAQLGFASYPDFQRRLRGELVERFKSPLEKAPPRQRGSGSEFLPRFAARLVANLEDTVHRLPAAEFEAVCATLGDRRSDCHIVGGRFTDAIAAYLAAHLRIVRAGVRKLEGRWASRADQLLDVKARDCVVIFDIRRYDDGLLAVAKAAKARRARVILVTDAWISPVSRFARHVLPCSVDVGRTWDSSSALFALSEAIIARVTELCWDGARERMAAKEAIER